MDSLELRADIGNADHVRTDADTPEIHQEPDGWVRIPISHIEDLKDAVYGAGLKAVQMTRAPVTGSLLFAEYNGIICSSGLVGGRVTLSGPLSESMVTFGVGLRMAPGTRHWLKDVSSGGVGLFMQGDEHDALYYPGSLYVALTVSPDRVEELAAGIGRVLDVRRLGGTGIHPSQIGAADLDMWTSRFASLHAGTSHSLALCEDLLRLALAHYGRLPRTDVGRADYRGYSRIVRRSRAYIEQRLQDNLSLDQLAGATGTSVRTLFRAFGAVLGESPQTYIRRLRLHHIRHDLLHDTDPHATVTRIAQRWGVTELGRFAFHYRELFGERPSETFQFRGVGHGTNTYLRLAESA